MADKKHRASCLLASLPRGSPERFDANAHFSTLDHGLPPEIMLSKLFSSCFRSRCSSALGLLNAESRRSLKSNLTTHCALTSRWKGFLALCRQRQHYTREIHTHPTSPVPSPAFSRIRAQSPYRESEEKKKRSLWIYPQPWCCCLFFTPFWLLL